MGSYSQLVGRIPRLFTSTLPEEISTGTFQTPEILEGSGIGDPKLLRQQGVEPLVDLPGVGNNLRK